jgi:hypothetical protein
LLSRNIVSLLNIHVADIRVGNVQFVHGWFRQNRFGIHGDLPLELSAFFHNKQFCGEVAGKVRAFVQNGFAGDDNVAVKFAGDYQLADVDVAFGFCVLAEDKRALGRDFAGKLPVYADGANKIDLPVIDCA